MSCEGASSEMSINPDLKVVLTFVEGLWQSGVHDVCISPGSRSTPLAIACARHPSLRVFTLRDERSAGFFALGLARAQGRAVALICTSGTAPANYMPAVIEAYYSRVPLIVVTADRPPELRGIGSNQTVDQVKLYGSHVKWSVDMPIPQDTKILDAHAQAIAARSAFVALSSPSGPVHINWPFREPLLPPSNSDVDQDAAASREGAIAAVSAWEPERRLPEGIVQDLLQTFIGRRGLIVCGPIQHKSDGDAIAKLADRLHYPILADPLSGLRTLQDENELVIDTYDVFLREVVKRDATDPVVARILPEVIIRFGQPPTSKALGQFLKMASVTNHSGGRATHHIVIEEDAWWKDPYFLATDVVHIGPRDLWASLDGTCPNQEMSAFSRDWISLNQTVRESLDEAIAMVRLEDGLFEGRVMTELADILPDGSQLCVGNSMPIRDMDSFFPKVSKNITVFGNRGASGIDGVVSTAVGIAANQLRDFAQVGKPTVLVIGDLSFYHDLNGLLAAKEYALDLVIVLIHNDGGGIFSFLPQASQSDVFSYFSTSHGLDFEPVVHMYGGQFTKARNWTDFRESLTSAIAHGGLHVVELRTDREENVALHDSIFANATEAVWHDFS